jgi:uncharacterized protein YceH (UPF0502 family)
MTPIQLSENETRVLGVLIEKSLTQPTSYPLTLNAIVLGANQLQNRDPVIQLSDADASAAIRTLSHKKLVEQAPPSPGARANRFRHRVGEEFRWDRRQQAIMAELMLRGRQTAGELRGRASRMTTFQDVDSVMVTLGELMSGDTKFVEEMPREPGRSANRFRQRLSPDAMDSTTVQEAAIEPSAPRQSPDPPHGSGEAPSAGSSWAERLSALERRVEFLERIVNEWPSRESTPLDS